MGLRNRNGAACFFRVLPRFKHRSEGQRVVVGDQCTLHSAKAGLSLHVSERAFDDGGEALEVNASGTLSTGLRLAPFSDYHPRSGECVMGGDCLRLYHAEVEGPLTLDPRGTGAAAGADAAGAIPGGAPLARAAVAAAAYAAATPGAGGGGGGGAGPLYLRVGRGEEAAALATSNSLWEVEPVGRGGPLTWSTGGANEYASATAPLGGGGGTNEMSAPLRLRHVGTGLYLCAASASAPPPPLDAVSSPRAVLRELAAQRHAAAAPPPPPPPPPAGPPAGIPSPPPPSSSTLSVVPADIAHGGGHAGDCTLFRFESTQVESSVTIARNATVRLRAAGSGDVVRALSGGGGSGGGGGGGGGGSSSTSFSRDGATALHVPLCLHPAADARDQDAFILRPVERSETHDVMTSLSVRAQLLVLAANLGSGRVFNGSRFTADAAAVLRGGAELIQDLCRFLRGGECGEARGAVAAAAAGGGGGGGDDEDEGGTAVVPDRQRVLREQGIVRIVVELLGTGVDGVLAGRAAAAAGADARQAEAAAHGLRLARLCYRLVGLCFEGNRRNALHVSRWLPMFVRHTCRLGAGASLGAEEVLTALLNADREILGRVSVAEIDEFITNTAATRDARFVALLGALCHVGDEAVERNQDQLVSRMLDAETAGALLVFLEDRGEAGLWLKFADVKRGEWMPIDDFLAALSPAVTEYMYELLRLLALLCTVRNYNAINALTPLYSADALLRVVEGRALPPRLRARATDLLLALHVDRDPMAALQVPSFARVWADAASGIAHAPGAVLERFGRIRGFLVAHVTEAGGGGPGEVELTVSVLALGRALLRFGAFPTAKDVRAFVRPMLKLLEYRGGGGGGGAGEAGAGDGGGDAEGAPDDDEDAGSVDDAGEGEAEGAAAAAAAAAIGASKASSPRLRGGAAAAAAGAGGGEEEGRTAALWARRCKLMMCQIMLYLCDLRVDYRVTCFLAKFKAAAGGGAGGGGAATSVGALAGRLKAVAHAVSKLKKLGSLHSMAAATPAALPASAANYIARDHTEKGSGAQDGIASDGDIALFNAVFEEDTSDDSLDNKAMFDGDFVPTILAMTLEASDPALVNAAFELMIRTHSQKRETLAALARVQLLVDSAVSARAQLRLIVWCLRGVLPMFE